MSGSHNSVVAIIQTVFEYTPESVDKLLGQYRRTCQHSQHIECRFNPAKHQFTLEGDAELMEYALCNFMDNMRTMTVTESRKQNSEMLQRSNLTRLNSIPVRWTENLHREEVATNRWVTASVGLISCRQILLC